MWFCLIALYIYQVLLSLPGDWIWVVDLGCDRIRHYRKSDSGPQPVLTSDIGQNLDEDGANVENAEKKNQENHVHDDKTAPGAGWVQC